MGLRYCPKTNSGSNIPTQNDSSGISYKLSYRQQAKVHILILLSSKGHYLDVIYFKNLPKNVATTTALIIPWPLVIPTDVKKTPLYACCPFTLSQKTCSEISRAGKQLLGDRQTDSVVQLGIPTFANRFAISALPKLPQKFEPTLS